MANKTMFRVILEGLIIGLLFIMLSKIIEILVDNDNKYIHLYITAFLFHIFCEISGINVWYVKDYIKLLNNN